MINAQNIDGLNPVAQLPIVLNLGTISATATDIAAVALPFKARLKRIDLYAESVSGTTPTLEISATGTTTGSLGTTSNLTAAGNANLISTKFDQATATGGETVYLGATVSGTSPSFTGVICVLWLALADNRDVTGSTQGTTY